MQKRGILQAEQHECVGDSLVFRCKNLGRRMSSIFNLSGVNLDLQLGKITGIVGENGNGKTTLLNLVAGELRHDKGWLAYPLFNPAKKNWVNIKRSVAYIPQNLKPLVGINQVRQQLLFTGALKGLSPNASRQMCDFVVNRLGLQNEVGKLWSELSTGFRLRFELAKQLMWQPKLLVLDEPLANLDIKSQMKFLVDIKNLAQTASHAMAIIISSQNIYEVEKVADKVIFLKGGAPVEDELVNTQKNYRCYEVDVDKNADELKAGLEGIHIIEIKDNSFYKLVYTGQETSAAILLHRLAGSGITVKYFRDITDSSRMYFEK
ncbi:MAG TPA: ABC transporter ATP-binding protein [Chitinophagaceae bacterium]|nr:ABC transporter ATP-binding protein [Chitinophagaceae bacterium]